MKKNGRVSDCEHFRFGVVFLLACLFGGPLVLAHSPLVDADLTDWCVGAFSNTAPGGGRTEDASATLTCGNCSVTTDFACQVTSDCPDVGDTCINLTSKVEVVWWDDRTDGAVNDLATVATTFDNNNLYFVAELWVDPDPLSLPFGEIAIDFTPGGIAAWHDPGAPVNGFTPQLTNSGSCSVSTDRGCARDADCFFCTESQEPFPSTRLRACGSGCNPDIETDVCNTSQTCTNLGSLGTTNGLGVNSDPASLADYLVVFDFSRWLAGTDAVALYKDVAGVWTIRMPLVAPAVNPGASGGSGGPPGSVEVAIPWSLFGCTGCPAACDCPDFGPGQDYRFSMIVARGASDLDFAPDGAIEDTMSEAVGGTTTTSTDDCAGFGIGNTTCEIADGSVDSFVPLPPSEPGGRSSVLLVDKNAAPSITLNWGASSCTGDTDYEIYEGDIGTWYSHVQVPGLCSTGGATSATFNAGGGNKYYLVVPTDLSIEGSYGEGLGVERPASTTPCRAQSLATTC